MKRSKKDSQNRAEEVAKEIRRTIRYIKLTPKFYSEKVEKQVNIVRLMLFFA